MERDLFYKELVEKNCVKKGEFTLKNGEVSSYYVDIKNIISYPKLVKKIGDKIFEMLEDFDVICGIPYGGLPIAVYISTTYNKPLIYIRDKVKSYGTKKLIEGQFNSHDRCAVVDDVLTTGGSIEKDCEILRKNLNVVDKAVVVNRNKNYKIKCLLEI